MDERLRLAYITAMKAQHDGGRVEVHLGSAVVAHLKALSCPPAPAEPPAWISDLAPVLRFGGFPILEKTGPGATHHISVHVVTTIA